MVSFRGASETSEPGRTSLLNSSRHSGFDARPGTTVPSITHPQSDAAVDGVADRLRSERAVDKQIGDPAIGDAESYSAAIFEPVLVSDRRHHRAVAGHGGDDTGTVGKRLHESTVDIALDGCAEQMRPLPAEFDQIGGVGAGRDRGAERVERD